MEPFLQACDQVLLSPEVWLVVFAAAVFGVFMGAVPGLTATMAVALLVPVVYFMDPVPAIAALVTLTTCAIFAGDIPNALLRIPGTPASAAYTDDAYALTRQGEADRALAVSLGGSVAGGLVGLVVLVLFAPSLANFAATAFSVAEYFWLYLLGLSCAVIVSRGSVLRAALALVIGLALSTVGLSAVHAEARLTFGRPELYQGVGFIPAMIGLFGVSEILRNLVRREEEHDGAPGEGAEVPGAVADLRPARGILRRLLLSVGGGGAGMGLQLRRRKRHLLRSGIVGSGVGMLPGAGADIGSWVSVAASKRFSKSPEKYGRGSIDAVADGATAKNAALAGAWVPALVFAIPGDSITAIVIGVLLMKNVVPGPEIFQTQAPLVHSIYLLFLIANLVLVVVGLAAIKAGGLVRLVPKRVLLPVILLFCVTGAYAINGSYFDVAVMATMGVLGYLLERREVPLGPVVLGIILGAPLEERFIQAMTAGEGSILALFSRPVAAALGAATLLLLLSPLLGWWRERRKGAAETAGEEPRG